MVLVDLPLEWHEQTDGLHAVAKRIDSVINEVLRVEEERGSLKR